jgi:tetratricopeptide (TPR) repeat protein
MRQADAVISARRSPAERAATDLPPSDLSRSNVLRQYLERPSNYVTVDDGEVTGLAGANPNWTFARLLLDRINPIPPDDVFVAAWYHGAASFLLRRGNFAEVVPLLDHAVEILPEDARLLFDRGTVEESLAMGLFQQASTLPEDRHEAYIPGSSLTSKPVRDVTLANPVALNARARGSYERAIEINPGLIEAHVRLARQLELIGEFARAAGEIKVALGLDPVADVAFYAHLLGARAANALGRDDDAEAHVQAALQLYPEADSAWLAASQTSLHRSDPGAAIERLGKLTEAQESTAPTTAVRDPWPDYIYGAGRLVKIALTELWGLAPAFTER